MIHTRFMHFSCTHLSHSQKDGYLWRKKLNNRTLSVSLRTRLPEIAKFRAQKLTIQYVRIKELSLPFESLRNVLKSYRDRLVDDALLMVLEGGSDMSTMPITTVYEKAMHPVSEVLEEWCEDNRADWKLRTEKLNRRSVNLFIEWAKRHSIKNVEDVTNVARRFFLHQNAINFALPEGAKKTHSAQCKNERKECLLMLLLSRITFVESRQADPIFESYITM